MGDFDGKVVIITGGALGIGQATALEFVKAGGRVVIADVNRAAGDDTVREIKRLGGEGLMVQADVSISSECERGRQQNGGEVRRRRCGSSTT